MPVTELRKCKGIKPCETCRTTTFIIHAGGVQHESGNDEIQVWDHGDGLELDSCAIQEYPITTEGTNRA